jgi:hypothetical protein
MKESDWCDNVVEHIKAKARKGRFKGQNASHLVVKGCIAFFIVRFFCFFLNFDIIHCGFKAF